LEPVNRQGRVQDLQILGEYRPGRGLWAWALSKARLLGQRRYVWGGGKQEGKQNDALSAKINKYLRQAKI